MMIPCQGSQEQGVTTKFLLLDKRFMVKSHDRSATHPAMDEEIVYSEV